MVDAKLTRDGLGGQKAVTLLYADGPSVTCDVYVETDPQKVWDLVTNVHLAAELSPELQRVEWLGGADRPTVGASFLGYNSHERVGDWRTESHVTEVEQPNVFGWIVTDVDGSFVGADGVAASPTFPAATWRYELTPEATGTRLRQSVRIGPGRSGVSMVIDQAPEHEEAIVSFRLDQLRTHIELGLEGIKALAEGRPVNEPASDSHSAA